MKSLATRIRWALPLVLLAGGLCHPSPSLAAPKPATVLAGSVVVKRKNVRTTTTLRANGQLEEGDVVASVSGGKASLSFADGSQVELAPESAVEIAPSAAKDGDKAMLRLLNGRIKARLTSGKTLATRTALVRVKGTEVVLAIAPDGATTLEVLEGAAEFSNPCGQVIVSAGMKSDLNPSSPPGTPTAIPDVKALLKEWESLGLSQTPPR